MSLGDLQALSASSHHVARTTATVPQRDGRLLHVVCRKLLASDLPRTSAHATARRPVAAAAAAAHPGMSWQFGRACATTHLVTCNHQAGR